MPLVEQRKAARHRLIRSAQLIFPFEGVIDDCVIFDQSDDGALVEWEETAPVPPKIILRFSTGETFLAQRRWQRGRKLGLKFSPREAGEDDTGTSLRLIGNILDRYGPAITARTLRAVRHYNEEALRRATEEAEAAEAQLIPILSAIETVC
jgi:hypothetical protein